MNNKFIHLHTHSHYSLLNALPKIDELVEKAKEYKMEALALTDNGNMYGTIEFYKTCLKNNIKPIIGVDFYVAVRSRKDMNSVIDSKRTRLVLLAKNLEGYKNLTELVTFSHMEGYYYKPRIDKELIERYKNDLVCIIPSQNNSILNALKNKDPKKAQEEIIFLKNIFKSDLYFELTCHPEIEGHSNNMKTIYDYAKESGVPVVAGQDVFYLNKGDKPARDTLTLVNSNLDASERPTDNDDENFSFISESDAVEFFKDTPEALENSVKIASECNLKLELGKWVFPKLDIESGFTHDEKLKDIVYRGIEFRNLNRQDEVLIKRIEYELEVIKNKGYAPYFLTVADLLKYARENKILTNIRGSVAGSIVTYLAGITNVNPIEYGLPFERFLNPERPSAPDIDMDYADNRRDEMIDYARKKYGTNNVAQIGTFGTMAAKGSVRDVARALGYPYELGDGIAKLIPLGAQGFPMTIDRAIEEVEDLRNLISKNKDVQRVIAMARKIEGCARHISVHAAGVVISPTKLTDFTPLQYDSKGDNKIITQYDMHAVEDAGLLKFDFLGIKNLSILAEAIDRVEKIEGIKIDIDNIPIDDPKTFEMLSLGDTEGVFQLNGDGMTKYLKDLKPTTIHDINAMVALYRPGPLEMIPEYIERKHNPRKVRFLDPRLKDILDKSFGVITYQDDVMMIAIRLAGYSWLDADKLRKAMGKKIPKEMQEQKEKLLSGFIKNNLSEEKAQELWKLIEPFAAYGFNKAHAASYGRVAYQTAYMKANFREIYMSSILTAESGNIEKIGELVNDCKKYSVPVLPPDINESYSQFTTVKSETHPYTIRFGLVTIKNFGEGISKTIIEERKKNGKFTSLINFLDRVKDRNINKKSIEALIKAGALDSFLDRATLWANVENLLNYNKEQEKVAEGQDSLFGMMIDKSTVPTLKLDKKLDIKKEELLVWEKEVLGLYISGHPLDKYRDMMEKRDVNIKKIKDENKKNREVMIAGIIETIKVITTKNNEQMAFARVLDLTGSIEVVFFPRAYKEHKSILVQDSCIALKGKTSIKEEVISILAENVKKI